MIEVEFGWVVGGGVSVQSHNHVKPNSVEVVLRLSWGCDYIQRVVLIVLIFPPYCAYLGVQHILAF